MLNILVVFLGALLTGSQAVLIFLEKEALCFNEGCEVVDSLTRVPPVVFNIFGCLFFLMIAYFLIRDRQQKGGWHQLAMMFLMGGMAAEGVLVAFQHFIAQTFCSYCLIVCGFVVLANLIAGMKHFLKGVAVFAAIIVAFTALSFSPPSSKTFLEDGTYGYIVGEQSEKEYYLFFSETCPHCEEVIEKLENEEMVCKIQFNPVFQLSQPPMSGTIVNESYNPQANLSFLKNLGIKEIPVLFVKTQQEMTVLKGKRAIQKYLRENCMVSNEESDPLSFEQGESSVSSDGNEDFLLPTEEENCEISTDTNC